MLYCDSGSLADALAVGFMVAIVLGMLIVLLAAISDIYNSHIARIKRASHPAVVGSVHTFADDPDLLYTITDVDSDEAEVTGIVTILIPIGTILVSYNWKSSSTIEVAYKKPRGGYESYDFDASPTPVGLDGWTIKFNRKTLIKPKSS